jgi:predicted nucleic acid-binding protein
MNGTTDAPRVYLDSNVFIEAFEGRGRLAELLRRLLRTLDNPSSASPRLVTSELTAAELLVKPLELDRQDLVQVYDNWTISNPYLEVIPVVRNILKDAARLKRTYKCFSKPT